MPQEEGKLRMCFPWQQLPFPTWCHATGAKRYVELSALSFRLPFLRQILCTGESGAGKTEATKLIVNWFAVVGKGDSQIYRKMVVSSHILEAFGNARTQRNH